MDPKQGGADLSPDPSLYDPFHHPKEAYKDPDDGRQRFLLELEFIQCLANPTYIHYLAQNRYFDDEAFIGYLKYLQYWQRPEYVKFIMYPHCLFFLELLQNANFRNAMAHPQNKVLHSCEVVVADISLHLLKWTFNTASSLLHSVFFMVSSLLYQRLLGNLTPCDLTF
ncbi:mediator of RNA polymerase II transcription subunit 31 isoform X3 [Cryptomeria japonica]|uniref:mediator of RNA polymerase II transcription subunit 31 isoform X3 n=1 Tax=Cryptomeria japonica TaxID=3369 RepID=UPI0027D9ED20|nr:mediator of RNA polymerase II transcription subunit 31 isoform X3 [Cryptomeria japonica]